LPDIAHRSPTEPTRPDDASEIAFDERDRRVPIAMPTWTCAKAGRSLIPSPAIATKRPPRVASAIVERRPARSESYGGQDVSGSRDGADRASVLYPVFGLLLNPMNASAVMAMSSVTVIGSALRLRTALL
jgi:hypothetical protein